MKSFIPCAFAIATLAIMAGCGPSPEEKWESNLRDKCFAMGGVVHYDRSTHTFECYRHPIGRMTKNLFTETFPGAGQ